MVDRADRETVSVADRGGMGSGGAGQSPRSHWERSWGGENRRTYAYTSEFDPSKGNTFETHIRRTTPVGVFPDGATPTGIMDLTGNVWDWTSSAYVGYDEAHTSESEDPARTDVKRVLRGGSWDFDRDFARAAFRSNFRPDFRNDGIGFRVVCASAHASPLGAL